jgi:hypothetical protein
VSGPAASAATPVKAPPRPETTVAWLISKGFLKHRWTQHEYLETRLAKILSGETVWVHYFLCRETGAIRMWSYTACEDTPDFVEDDIPTAASLEGAQGEGGN